MTNDATTAPYSSKKRRLDRDLKVSAVVGSDGTRHGEANSSESQRQKQEITGQGDGVGPSNVNDTPLRTPSPTARPHHDDSSSRSSTLSTTSSPPPSQTQSNNNRTVFIGGLHPRVAQVHLEKLLQPYGTMERLTLCRRGYAFCAYETALQAQAAIEALHGRVLLNKRLVVQPARERNDGGYFGTMQKSTTTTTTTTTRRHETATSSSSSSSSREQEQKSVESKIQALKRKLKETAAESNV